ncbi:MAG: saccharopine dehydrogenase NADP-binding domain-containing protein [Candidatus Heimdallarchaeota archaeon]
MTMKVLLLGVGLQGKVALHDLVQSEKVTEIIAADYDIKSLQDYVKTRKYSKVETEFFDASKQEDIDKLIGQNPDVVIDLLPVNYMDSVAKTAVKHSINLVNTFYLSHAIKELDKKAKNNGIAVLPEFGMDPGIDLVLMGEAMRGLENVEVINSYGAGIPELEAANNPLKYKVTWTFEGVLRSYFRAGRIIKDGKVIEIKENDMFNPKHIHEMDIESIGKLEAIPNGDALKYLKSIGIEEQSEKFKQIKHMGRYSMRWPGHCEFWKKMVDLHLLDNELVDIDGVKINRKKYLAKVIEPHIQLEPEERDLAILLIELVGLKDGKKTRVIYQVIDKRDLKTGFTAMSRTVGFTASIGAQMLGTNQITKKGLLSPVNDIPFDFFKKELEKRNINIIIKHEPI